MWCKHCRQDVPAIAGSEPPADDAAPETGAAAVSRVFEEPIALRTAADHFSSRYICTRCGEPIGSDPAPALWDCVSDLGIDLSASPNPPPAAKRAAANAGTEFAAWQWELDQELYDVRRLLDRREGRSARETEPPLLSPPLGHAPQHRAAPASTAAFIEPAIEQRPANVAPERAQHTPRTLSASPFSWLLLMLGLTAFVCGGILLGWSMRTGRSELWNLGVPIAIGGQAVLFVSLLMMLARSRRAIHVTAAEPGAGSSAGLSAALAPEILVSSTPHQSFYRHLAEGAQPHLLMADLKNQLDLLAIRMARPGQ